MFKKRNGISLETYGLTLDQPRWEWLSSLTMVRKIKINLAKLKICQIVQKL